MNCYGVRNQKQPILSVTDAQEEEVTTNFNLLRCRLETERKHLIEELEQPKVGVRQGGERRQGESLGNDEVAMEYFELEKYLALQKRITDRLAKVHHHLKASMIDFGGWDLPVWYTSILEEHKAVRSGAGMFDVSHMGRVLLTGKKARPLLDRVLTKPAQQMEVGGG